MNHARLIREAERRLRKQLRGAAEPQPSLPPTTLETQAVESAKGCSGG